MNHRVYRKNGSIGHWLQYSLMTLMLSYSTTVMAQQYSAEQYNQKLNEYIAIVNETKTVLDDPDTKASAIEQKESLCQRIAAYRNIVRITTDNLQHENAFVMQLIAQSFLSKQQASFQNSGINEADFCALIKV